MGKYHTVFLTQKGVYFCGLRSCVGERVETLALSPCKIPFTDFIIDDISVGEHHTLFCGNGAVFSCGKNTFYALGFSDSPSLVSRPIRLLDTDEIPVFRICAGPQHSVIIKGTSVNSVCI